ncbi:MAG: hypothetical protein WAM73_07990, partial [Desulfobacterales bacterium]
LRRSVPVLRYFSILSTPATLATPAPLAVEYARKLAAEKRVLALSNARTLHVKDNRARSGGGDAPSEKTDTYAYSRSFFPPCRRDRLQHVFPAMVNKQKLRYYQCPSTNGLFSAGRPVVAGFRLRRT